MKLKDLKDALELMRSKTGFELDIFFDDEGAICLDSFLKLADSNDCSDDAEIVPR